MLAQGGVLAHPGWDRGAALCQRVGQDVLRWGCAEKRESSWYEAGEDGRGPWNQGVRA